MFGQGDAEKKEKKPSNPYLIGISGSSASGKTSIAKTLYEFLGPQDCLLFSMDTYYKNLTPEQEKDLDNYNFDMPEALDMDLLYEHLHSLMNWQNINMPTYDFSTNSRGKDTVFLDPKKIIIFEGILAFHDQRIRNLMNLKIFVDVEADICLIRRTKRDIINRGRQLATVIKRYNNFVKPAFDEFVYPTRIFADIIIPRGAENTLAVDIVKNYLDIEILE